MAPNSSTIERTVGTDLFGDDKNSIMSSAYKAILWAVPRGDSEIPSMLWLHLMASASGSRAIANSNGLRGSPCLVPLAKGKGSEHIPLVRTQATGE